MKPSMMQIGVAALLLSLAGAAPVEVEKAVPAGSFRVHQVAVRPGIKTSGPHAVLKTYLKYGKTPPADVSNAALYNDGTVTANPTQYDSEYLERVVVGTPGVPLNLDFDTGSADLWVFSSELPASEQSGHNIYNPAQSSTSRLLSGSTWSITYGDGSSASGNVYIDKVAVGATVFSNQAVECAQTVSSSFVSDQSDGLVGLAFDSINTVSPNRVPTFFDNVKSSLASPIFTANLKKGAPGSYNFGYIDTTEYTGSITYISVNTINGFWEFTGNGYAVGSGSFVSTSIDGIADTGTTLLYLPQSAVTAYYSRVSGAAYDSYQGGYTFPCSSGLPSITLGLGSYRAVVPGSYMNYAPVSSTRCFGGIQANTGIGFSIYGDIFLKSQFVVFQGTSPPRLGFAAKPT